jgi:hypothetical protein
VQYTEHSTDCTVQDTEYSTDSTVLYIRYEYECQSRTTGNSRAPCDRPRPLLRGGLDPHRRRRQRGLDRRHRHPEPAAVLPHRPRHRLSARPERTHQPGGAEGLWPGCARRGDPRRDAGAGPRPHGVARAAQGRAVEEEAVGMAGGLAGTGAFARRRLADHDGVEESRWKIEGEWIGSYPDQ